MTRRETAPVIGADPSPAPAGRLFSATPQHVRAFWQPTAGETWTGFAERVIDDDDARACLIDLVRAYGVHGDTPEPITLGRRHVTDGPLRVLAAHLAAVPAMPAVYEPDAPTHGHPRPWRHP